MFIEYNYPTYEKTDLIFDNDKPFSDYDFKKIVKGYFYLILQDGGLCFNNTDLRSVFLEMMRFRYATEYNKHKELIYHTNFTFHLDDNLNEILRIHNIKPNGDDELMEYYTHYLTQPNVRTLVDELIKNRIYKDWNSVLIDLFGGSKMNIAFDKMIRKTTIKKKTVSNLIKLMRQKKSNGYADSWIRIKNSMRYHMSTAGGTEETQNLLVGKKPGKKELAALVRIDKEKERAAIEKGKEYTGMIFIDSAIGYAENWVNKGSYTTKDLEFAVFMRLRLPQYWVEFCNRLKAAFATTEYPELADYFIERVSNWVMQMSLGNNGFYGGGEYKKK